MADKKSYDVEKIIAQRVTEQEKNTRRNISTSTQDLIEKIDKQRLSDIEIEFQRKATIEELEHSINKLNNHSLCTGNITCPKECSVTKNDTIKQEVIHSSDCHCSKCCPNPNPSWFEKHKLALCIGTLLFAMLVLAIGWLPSGETYNALQKSYVELIVNLPKMLILGAGVFASFKAFSIYKKRDN